MKTKVLAVLTAAMLVLLMAPAQGTSRSSGSYLSMSIVDNPPGFTTDVTSDGVNGGVYTDHDLLNGDTCVSATLSNDGFTQVQQNYLISTHPKDVWCNSAQSTARYWTMLISDPAACDALFGSSESGPPCAVGPVSSTDYERILPGNAFSSSSSRVTFQFTLNGTGYSVQTDFPVTITQGSNSCTLTYSGNTATAKLYHSGTAISGSFLFAFQLVLEKS